MGERHKHYDCIVAWANGAEIEYECPDGHWTSAGKVPTWNPHYQYRVKPEEKKKVKRWLWVYLDVDSVPCIGDRFMTEEEAVYAGVLCKATWTEMEFEE